MSDREWYFYLDDMIHFAENVVAYCENFDLETFERTGLNYDATVRNLELIGEAANHIPETIKKLIHPCLGDKLLQLEIG